MSDHSTRRERGFSLLEMTVAMALGTLVLGAAVQLYSQGVAATWTVSQRAEMQQDFRAASNMITKDLSLAGAGLPNAAAIALPTAVTPVYGCDQSGTCYLGVGNNTGVNYPKQGTTPYLYGLLPGYNAGPTVSTPPGQTDAVTVVYTDTALYLNCYAPTITARGVVTFAPVVTVPATSWPPPGCLPSNVTPSAGVAPQYLNDPVLGLTPGDLVLMTLNSTTFVAEVTGAVTSPSANTFVVPFANNDVLHMNQTPTGTTAGLNSIPLNATGAGTPAPCGRTGPCRIFVITYYIDNKVSPPRLMRQINGHTPMPMADSTVYMKFSYDLYNDASSTPAISCINPGISGDVCKSGNSTGLLPNQITKINILHMATDSALKGTTGYQGLDLETSVSARNLTFANDYPQAP
ncbi:MAG: prepilin-type N-terminal cleavage/methylation domain-containing protein [Acidobacteriia bacterium]|nr:prepilin-type N-terminal cleavage/methylation domain-containing protein [Terriglobia bacterium]